MPELEEKINLLKEIPFFPSLTSENYKTIAEKCRIVNFPINTTIFSQNDPGNYFYIIQSGKVKIVREEKGKEKTIATLGKSEFFGEMALLTGEPRSASVVTLKETICLELSKEDFNTILEMSPSLALNLSKVLSRRLLQSGIEEKEEEPGQAISVYGVKDRMGKSTLVLNLSLYLARELKKKVVLLDLDLQYGDLTFILGAKPERTIFDLCQKKSYDIELIDSYLFSHPSGLKILPSPFKIEDGEIIEDKDIISLITQLKENYDFVIIDTSSYLSPNTISALDCSNYILFLIISDILALKNSKTSLELMKNLQYPEEKIKVILTSVSQEVDLAQNKIQELLNKEIKIVISFDSAVHQAILNGVPLLEFKPNSPALQGIIKCAHLFVDKEKQIEKPTSSSKFLRGLSKFRKK